MRGEAALKARQSKEARKNATITSCERSFSDSSWTANFQFRFDEPNLPLEGYLVQCAQNGKTYSSIIRSRLVPLVKMLILNFVSRSTAT